MYFLCNKYIHIHSIENYQYKNLVNSASGHWAPSLYAQRGLVRLKVDESYGGSTHTRATSHIILHTRTCVCVFNQIYRCIWKHINMCVSIYVLKQRVVTVTFLGAHSSVPTLSTQLSAVSSRRLRMTVQSKAEQ